MCAEHSRTPEDAEGLGEPSVQANHLLSFSPNFPAHVGSLSPAWKVPTGPLLPLGQTGGDEGIMLQRCLSQLSGSRVEEVGSHNAGE